MYMSMLDYSTHSTSHIYPPPPADRRFRAEVWRPSYSKAGSPSYSNSFSSVPAEQKLPEDPQLAVREQVASSHLTAPSLPLRPKSEHDTATQLHFAPSRGGRRRRSRRANTFTLENSPSSSMSLYIFTYICCFGSCKSFLSYPYHSPTFGTHPHTTRGLLL